MKNLKNYNAKSLIFTVLIVSIGVFHLTPPATAEPVNVTDKSVVELAETVTGLIRTVGSANFAMVKIFSLDKAAGADKGVLLCKNEISKRLKRVSNMKISLTGIWEAKGDVQKYCLAASSFEVLATATGMPAVVGELSKVESGYRIVDGEGKLYEFRRLPTGLRKMAGKKVIVGLRQRASPKSPKGKFKVVSYSLFP